MGDVLADKVEAAYANAADAIKSAFQSIADERDRLAIKNAVLREALLHYGSHRTGCAYTESYGYDACNCGFKAAVECKDG